jgi:ribosomal protein S18 acetylase RimI-like enzyme
MPHKKMQEYVNVDYGHMMSVVALVRDSGQEKIVAEARYVKDPHNALGNLAFVVDETYQGVGIGSYLYEMLIRLAQDRGLKGFTAEVLQANQSMMKVFEKGPLHVNARVDNGLLRLRISFDEPSDSIVSETA